MSRATVAQSAPEPKTLASDTTNDLSEPAIDATPMPSEALPLSAVDVPWLTPRRIARWTLVVLTLTGIIGLLYVARAAMFPFVIGLVLSYLLLPPVNRLSHYMPRWAAILLVYLISFGLLFAVIAFMLPPVLGQTRQLFLQTIPNWYNNEAPRVQQYFAELISQYRETVPLEMQTQIDQGINNALSAFRNNAVTYITSFGSFLINQVLGVVNTVIFLFGLLIVPVWLFYVLKDQRQAIQTIDRLLPAAVRYDFWNIMALIDRALSAYIRGQLLLGLIVGVVCGLGLAILDLAGFQMNYILLLALIAGVTELIPFIGPTIGAIPAILVGLTHSPMTGLAVLILYISVQQLEAHILVPRVVGGSLDVHPAILMVTLLIGVQVFGLLGVILAAPLTAIARDIFVYLYQRLQDPESSGC